jgi:hypothetical protein
MSAKTKAKKRLGCFVRQKRLAKGITLRKFAELVGVSPTYLFADRTGELRPADGGAGAEDGGVPGRECG